MRERRSGVWEIRVVVANDQLTGHSVQRSFTIHGDRATAEERRELLVERFGVDRRALYCEGARWSVAELLTRLIEAAHQWRPATRSSHTSVVRFLTGEPLGAVGVEALAPMMVDEAIERWRRSGASNALVWGRWAVLHSALSWATAQGMIRSNPIPGMRPPRRPHPRKHLLPGEVAQLLATATELVDVTEAGCEADPTNRVCWEGLFVAEQTLLLVRLAADSGARRGELATLRLGDLAGRVLTIERNLSAEVLGPTKTGRTRRLTIGATTAAMIREHFDTWEPEPVPTPSRATGSSRPIIGGVSMPVRICCRTVSCTFVRRRVCPQRRCTGSATASPPNSWLTARSSKPKHVSGTATLPPHCATTPTPPHSTTSTSPTTSTNASTPAPAGMQLTIGKRTCHRSCCDIRDLLDRP